MRFSRFYFVLTISLMARIAGLGCDLCGCFTPQLNAIPENTTVSSSPISRTYFAFAEQFTRFGTLQLDGQEVANPTNQYLNSSITQAVLGYDINNRFALQVALPIIYRDFQR